MAQVNAQHRKIAIYILVGATILIIAYFIYKHFSTTPTPSKKSGSKGSSPSSYTDTIDVNKKLKKGDSGNSVMALQKQLNALGGHLTVDGQFGGATEAEAKKQFPSYSSSVGISVTDLNPTASTSDDIFKDIVNSLTSASTLPGWLGGTSTDSVTTPDTVNVSGSGIPTVYDDGTGVPYAHRMNKNSGTAGVGTSGGATVSTTSTGTIIVTRTAPAMSQANSTFTAG